MYPYILLSDPFPKTGPSLPALCFGTGRYGPAWPREPFPRTPHVVGSAGEPVWGGLFGPGWSSCQNGSCAPRPHFPAPQTNPVLTDPIFVTERSGPVVTRGPSPRAPHGVGSVGEPAGGLFGPVGPRYFWVFCAHTIRPQNTLDTKISACYVHR